MRTPLRGSPPCPPLPRANPLQPSASIQGWLLLVHLWPELGQGKPGAASHMESPLTLSPKAPTCLSRGQLSCSAMCGLPWPPPGLPPDGASGRCLLSWVLCPLCVFTHGAFCSLPAWLWLTVQGHAASGPAAQRGQATLSLAAPSCFEHFQARLLSKNTISFGKILSFQHQGRGTSAGCRHTAKPAVYNPQCSVTDS